MQAWQLLTAPGLSGFQNMEWDRKLFQDFEQGLIPPTLRIYSWKANCVSFGYSQKMERLIDREMVGKVGWEVVKRPTGGGMVFHNKAEITYSLVMAVDDPILPEGLVPSYIKISQAVLRGLKLVGVEAQILNPKLEILNKSEIPGRAGLNPKLKENLCFSSSENYEITVEGRKLVGSAQKRGRRKLLQQGSVFVRNDLDGILSALKNPVSHDQYAAKAISVEEILGREVSFKELAEALMVGFEEELDVRFKSEIRNPKF